MTVRQVLKTTEKWSVDVDVSIHFSSLGLHQLWTFETKERIRRKLGADNKNKIWLDSIAFILNYLPETGFCPDVGASDECFGLELS